ncbi:hypothetical protein [Leptolyngbya sp. NIES-2104]|uniref:hypothetical protein n=1 Tax=Leptolyngbya sp. NIES-2104 TaxID=1552121 RepID=UPI00073F0D72|nr:hypothetical protein [Leptolyngbya sp. NIES-2104]
MLSTLLACFLLWVLYLWFDRQRLIRFTHKPAPTYQTHRSSTPKPTKQKRNPRYQRFFDAVTGQTRPQPTKPKFINSAPNSSHTSQTSYPQSTPKPPKEATPSPQPLQRSQPPTISRPPSSQHQSEINFDAIGREAARRRQDFAKVSSKTQYELYRLAHGDVKMIDRLLIHTRSRNPDRPEQWIWEKVICDLERDRGYR